MMWRAISTKLYSWATSQRGRAEPPSARPGRRVVHRVRRPRAFRKRGTGLHQGTARSIVYRPSTSTSNNNSNNSNSSSYR